MAFNYSPKPVIDSSLVLYLDAANPRSYVSGSSVWTDVSRGGNNGALTNGPTYSSANGGSILFDGTNDYVSIPDINVTNQISIEAWVYANSVGAYNAIASQWRADTNSVSSWTLETVASDIRLYITDGTTISFATKYVNESLLDYNPEGKIRIRFSLMPDKYARVLEPNTTSIDLRIKNIDRFIKAGYDVHINFSPVIVAGDWLVEYGELFRQIQCTVEYKDKVKAEVIFLTHNEQKHKYNLINNLPGEEEYLWVPTIQEDKISQYGGKNIRYKHDLKSLFIDKWTKLHNSIIPWNTIRYIF